jgi:hypothetical protein
MVPSGGSTMTPQVSADTGSFQAYVSGFTLKYGIIIGSYNNSGGSTYTAGTWTSLPTGPSFNNGGDMVEFYVIDNTNSRCYRCTCIHGSATNGGSICIERIA